MPLHRGEREMFNIFITDRIINFDFVDQSAQSGAKYDSYFRFGLRDLTDIVHGLANMFS